VVVGLTVHYDADASVCAAASNPHLPPYPLFSGSPNFNSVTHPHYSYPMKSTAMRNSYGRMDAGADDGECLGCAAR
jgi:hypothetical protein